MAARRDNITRRRDGRYQIAVWVEGRRVFRYARTYAEAETIAAELRANAARHEQPPDTRITVSRFFADWLETMQPPRLKPTTWAAHKSRVDTIIAPAIGSARLARLRPADLDRLYAALMREPRKTTGRPLARTTVHHVHALIHGALAYAVRMGILPTNPADKVTAPAVREADRPEVTRDQVAALVDAMRGTPWYALTVIALATGMRFSELAALGRRDVLADRGEVRCWYGLTRTRAAIHRAEPKQARQRRTIPIAPEAVRVLRDHLRDQAAARLAYGPGWGNSWDLVFTQPDGRPIHQSTFNRALAEGCRRACIPTIAPHALRHASAGMLLQAGYPVSVVSARLGHADAAITLRVYGRLIPADTRAAGDSLGALFVAGESGR